MTNTYKHAKKELDILAATVPDAIVTPFAKEILGYSPFKEETTTAKDWNEATEEELLEEAIRRYPIGCKIKLIGQNIGGNFKNEVRFTKYRFFNTISKRKQLYVDNILLLFDGVWAEIESLPEIESKIENKEAFDAQNNSKLIEKCCCCSFQIGQTVYHRNVYEHKVPLKIVGILEDKLLLEGDFSGGTHNVIQREWLPVKGTSRIYNHDFKLNARKAAIDIETLVTQYTESQDNTNTFKSMRDIAHAATVLANTIMTLTNDVSLNPECE